MRMTRTTVDVDDGALAAARRELGTKGLSETVNAALREAARRRALAGFDVVRDVDGTPQQVVAGRSVPELRGRAFGRSSSAAPPSLTPAFGPRSATAVFPHLAEWFNAAVAGGRVLVCDLVVLELTRLAPSAKRAEEVAARLGGFESVPMPAEIWSRARNIQLALAVRGDHRRVPPAELLLAAAAEQAGVALVHYDRDYERIGAVTDLEHYWFVPDGSFA